MAECQSCHSHVSERYVRVSLPDDREHPKTCPHCNTVQSEGIMNLNGSRKVIEG